MLPDGMHYIPQFRSDERGQRAAMATRPHGIDVLVL